MRKNFVAINELHNYLVELFTTGRIGDRYPRIKHAHNIDEIILPLVGALVWRADPDSIEISTRLSKTGNLRETNFCWFTVNSRIYALAYHPPKIDLCDRNRRGPAIASFQNSNLSTIQPTFAKL